MGTHVLSKKGQDKEGQRFLKVLYERCFWSAWLCARWMAGNGDPGTREVSRTQWCAILCPQIQGTGTGTVFDVLITFNILLSCLWQMVSGRRACTFLSRSGPNCMHGGAPQAKSKHILQIIVSLGCKRFWGIKYQIKLSQIIHVISFKIYYRENRNCYY